MNLENYNHLAALLDVDAGIPTQEFEWPQPQVIKTDLPPAPPFDAKTLLPPTLADFVLDEADRMPCSPDYIAAALIVCLGSVIGARCGIKPKRRDDWIVTPNLFGGVVGDPSSKKSPALSTVTRFLDRLEAKEAEKLIEAKKIFEAEKAAFEAHQSAVKAAMKTAAVGKGDKLKCPPQKRIYRTWMHPRNRTSAASKAMIQRSQSWVICWCITRKGCWFSGMS